MANDMADEFEMIDNGRSGYVVYRRGQKKVQLYWEVSGNREYDIIFVRLGLSRWDEPEGEVIPRAEQIEILDKLRAWTDSQGIRTDISPPPNMELDDTPCIWAGCNEPRIGGFAFCRKHYDENLLA